MIDFDDLDGLEEEAAARENCLRRPAAVFVYGCVSGQNANPVASPGIAQDTKRLSMTEPRPSSLHSPSQKAISLSPRPSRLRS